MQSEIIDQIRAFHRQRCYAMESRKRADLALGAYIRTQLGWSLRLPELERKDIAKRASLLLDDCEGSPYQAIIEASIAARMPFANIEKRSLKEMERLASSLPVWDQFGQAIRGFGAGSLAVIVGEAGDLSNYSTHSKLWKRMGLAVMDGVRQGGLKKTSSKDLWVEHGYSPIRRSRMWNIGDTLMKGNKDGQYRTAYLARKEYERERALASGLTVAPAAKIPAKRKDEFMSDGHVHLRAQRYMEKRLLRNLWQAWLRAERGMSERTVCIVPEDEMRDAPSGAAEAVLGMPERASNANPPHQFTDASQDADQVTPSMLIATKSELLDPLLPDAPQGAGEATNALPSLAGLLVPLHQSRDAA